MKKRWRVLIYVVVLFIGIFITNQVMAYQTELFGAPLGISGYLNQSVQSGIAGDHYDTKEGFQSAITQFLLETQFEPSRKVRFFASGYLNMDLAYPILNNNNDWENREFDKSEDELFILDEEETLLKEAHVTFTPGNFYFRVGKQIVSWGQTDLIPLMDQINPSDQRRGITDVEVEATQVPIWLIKAEYFTSVQNPLIQDLSLEFTFNPNVQFIPTKSFGTEGNNGDGIWAVDVPAGTFVDFSSVVPGFYFPEAAVPFLALNPATAPLVALAPVMPTRYGRLGALHRVLDEPDNWDSDGYEYALRIKMSAKSTDITFNYFYGLDNNPITLATGNFLTRLAYDGSVIMEPELKGYYPLSRLAGLTVSRDMSFIRIKALGNVSPVLRLEAFYGFDNTFASAAAFEKHDEIRYAIGFDWDVKIKWINPRTGISISPQFIHQHIRDYPGSYGLSGTGGPLTEDTYNTTLNISTNYMHDKLQPQIFWQRSYSEGTHGDLFLIALAYEYSHQWNYKVQAVLFENDGLDPLDHKDNISFTVGYRF
jgi:hypothetical protein